MFVAGIEVLFGLVAGAVILAVCLAIISLIFNIKFSDEKKVETPPVIAALAERLDKLEMTRAEEQPLPPAVKQLMAEFGIANLAELRGQLADAATLYEVFSGKQSAALLMKVVAKNANWTPEQREQETRKLVDWIAESSITEG